MYKRHNACIKTDTKPRRYAQKIKLNNNDLGEWTFTDVPDVHVIFRGTVKVNQPSLRHISHIS